MKTNTIHLSAALRALVPAIAGQFSGVLLDPRARAAVATDGTAIAIIPFPEGFSVESPRFLPGSAESASHDCTASDGVPFTDEWGWEGVEEMATNTPPVYQIIIEPARLLALCQAMDTGESVMMEFAGADCPVKVSSPDSPARGYLMPAGGLGLLVAAPAAAAPDSAPLPPPVITASTERGTLEITFGGRPDKSILEALKHPSLAFSYSGNRGTKRGVPPLTWYGPDNPFTREKVSGILGTEVAA